MIAIPAWINSLASAAAAATASATATLNAAGTEKVSLPDRVLLNPARSLFLVVFGGTLLLLAVRRLRGYKLRERYALVFGLLGVPFIGLAFWPDGIGWLAEKLNIQYNTLALIGVTSFLFLAVFELLSIVSQQDQKITALAQLVGILMEQQKLVEKEHRPGASGASHASDSHASNGSGGSAGSPSSETRSPARV